MFIFVLIIVFAAVRTTNSTLESLASDKLISPTSKRTIELIIAVGATLQSMSGSLSPESLVIFLPLIPFGALLFEKISKFSRAARFKDNFCHFLDLLVLQMRSGHGFRSSFVSLLDSQSPFERQKWQNVYDFMVAESFDGGQFESEVRELILELRRIDRNPHNSLARLEAMRYRLQTIQDFRRRSRHATTQVRAQSIVIAILYLMTLVFVQIEFGSQLSRLEFWISVGLFSFGGLLMLQTGRRFKWKA